jgi:hypothetical protein
MENRRGLVVGLLLGLRLLAGGAALAEAETPPPAPAITKGESAMTQVARGPFEVKLIPRAPDEAEFGVVGRMTIDKQFHGDLEATSKGQMLAVRTEVDGSAGYVAMERVTGTLLGRSGSFALQHSGTMNRGVPDLVVTVVPDSGTGQLAGISGRMTIDITGGKHAYELRYELPAAP